MPGRYRRPQFPIPTGNKKEQEHILADLTYNQLQLHFSGNSPIAELSENANSEAMRAKINEIIRAINTAVSGQI